MRQKFAPFQNMEEDHTTSSTGTPCYGEEPPKCVPPWTWSGLPTECGEHLQTDAETEMNSDKTEAKWVAFGFGWG